MGALMEFGRMSNFSTGSNGRRSEDLNALAKAANVAVSHIAQEVENMGGTPEQAEAVKEAVRLGLLDEFQAAADRLLAVGFDKQFVEEFLSDLRSEKDGAAA